MGQCYIQEITLENFRLGANTTANVEKKLASLKIDKTEAGDTEVGGSVLRPLKSAQQLIELELGDGNGGMLNIN